MIQIPGWEGAIGPFPSEYGKPHVYARDVLSGAGNCVCSRGLGDNLHIQAAPGIDIPERMRNMIIESLPENVTVKHVGVTIATYPSEDVPMGWVYNIVALNPTKVSLDQSSVPLIDDLQEVPTRIRFTSHPVLTLKFKTSETGWVQTVKEGTE